jgi:flavin-dependent dehydrogenase
MNSADILVAGAGPAGATVARLLARHGRRVALVDPGTRGIERLEIIAPSGCRVLEALDLVRLTADDAIVRPCLGIRRRWGARDVEIDDFMRRPGGRGLVIDRARFDDALRAAAVEAGAELIEGRAVWARRNADCVAVKVRSRGREQTISVRLMIDATGRPAALARRLGARKLVSEVLIAEQREVTHADPGAPAWLDVEGHGNSWRYQVLGPDGRRESWAIYPSGEGRPHTARLRADASSALLSHAAGEGWIAIGDAAASFDPVTSQGLVNALSTALVAAGAILSPRGLDAEARRTYSAAVAATFRHSETGRASVYAALAR